jgi:hypothetical protein
MPTSTLPRRNSAADGCTKLTLCERQPNKRLQPTRLSSNVSNDQRYDSIWSDPASSAGERRN